MSLKINSDEVKVNASASEVLDFLGDSQNLIHILPKDNISEWKATATECSFKVQGGFVITLLQDGRNADQELYMKAGEKSPFPFRLTIHAKPDGTATLGHIAFDGEVNMFLKMMVEKPLSNLFNYMSKKLQEHFA